MIDIQWCDNLKRTGRVARAVRMPYISGGGNFKFHFDINSNWHTLIYMVRDRISAFFSLEGFKWKIYSVLAKIYHSPVL